VVVAVGSGEREKEGERGNTLEALGSGEQIMITVSIV